MEEKEFKAFVVEEENNTFSGKIKSRLIADLPQGDLLVKVHYSSLNYKDALSTKGNKGVTKNYPHTPGIDSVGIVVSSKNEKFKIDDKVIVTSYDLGMNTDGGFAEYIRVPSKWAVKLPENLTMKESMILGTAGLTAGMAVLKLSETIKPHMGKIVVSGATGGVGSLVISILSKLGYTITAITGKKTEHDYLLNLGVSEIISRKDFETIGNRAMLKTAFAGGIDIVGGVILENIIKSTQAMGVVVCCGNVASPKLNLTIFPFILRGISLIGIDSQNCPMNYREMIFDKLSKEYKNEQLFKNYEEIKLEELNDKIDLMVDGKLKGRILLNLNL